MGKTRHEDPIMQAVQKRFEASGLTLQVLGEKMGYEARLARQSAWQFLHTGDPQISMLRRFAEAMGIGLTRLLKD
jgi:transcriptional regulator with XRE-family HTH domain